MSTTRQQYREVLASLATKTLTKIPTLNGRTEKACRLVLQGDVTLLDPTTAEVGSLTDPGKHYRLERGVCECRDYAQAPEHLCAHRLAVGFARKVQELLPPAVESALEVHPVSTPPPAPLPEARSSANVRLTVAGHEVQVTLRDHDETALMVRLEELMQRYGHAHNGQPQAPAQADHDSLGKRETPAPEAGGLPQCPHGHGFLRKSTKREGYYCPHKWDDGSYCKGR